MSDQKVEEIREYAAKGKFTPPGHVHYLLTKLDEAEWKLGEVRRTRARMTRVINTYSTKLTAAKERDRVLLDGVREALNWLESGQAFRNRLGSASRILSQLLPRNPK